MCVCYTILNRYAGGLRGSGGLPAIVDLWGIGIVAAAYTEYNQVADVKWTIQAWIVAHQMRQ